ncbi:MAG: hypothetical protein EBX59_07585, partial [Betaproteobacteria bacterium]|nr:hypothetical protein [Betaproteobacteria bacterium]
MENYAIGWRGGFTLRWLAEVWSAYGSTVMASITIASATVFTTILIAVPCAYALARSKKAWALWFEELITLPLHRAIETRFAGTIASTAPSPAHQVVLDL